GIYMLFSPIQLYGANWPDALSDSSAPGFGGRIGKARMGTDTAAIAAQANYLRQILQHVNPYTGVALKNEPAILFIELVNEPWHHPEDPAGSIRYINALTGAVRSTGCDKLVFYNVSQDFRIAAAIAGSRAQGVTFGWYPSGLNAGRELEGNFLRAVDAFPDMLRPELARLPRIVYEFDTPDLRTGYLYPAMARTFRAVGAQFVAMFAYDMLRTAPRPIRAAQPRQDRDARDQPRLADDDRAAGPRHVVHGPTDHRGECRAGAGGHRAVHRDAGGVRLECRRIGGRRHPARKRGPRR